MLGGKQRDSMREEEEDLLQFAIQQSLLEAGSEYDQVGLTVTQIIFCSEMKETGVIRLKTRLCLIDCLLSPAPLVTVATPVRFSSLRWHIARV